MHTPSPYDSNFYDKLAGGSLLSARVVVPLVIDLVHPASVIDLGCGSGGWLKAFSECGVQDFLGVDGAWVDPDRLLFAKERFQAHDLEKPLVLPRRFDLAVTVEVLEHLKPSCAEIAVKSLTDAAPIVLFSAAIPGQGGTDHINEQWPNYWAELFKARGYTAIDCLRARLWNNDSVEWWYRQNLLLFACAETLKSNERLAALAGGEPLPLVHPLQLASAMEQQRKKMKPRRETASMGKAWRQFRWSIRKLFD